MEVEMTHQFIITQGWNEQRWKLK